MKLTAVCTGAATTVAAKSGITGHRKRPVVGPVAIGPLGLGGDVIVDTDHHGGPDQAVYLFTAPDRAAWAEQTGRQMPPGSFGENLCLDATESATLCVGDMIRIKEVLLQVTSPRIPCASFAAVTGLPDALRLFRRMGRPGAYLRVLQGGSVQTGDPATLIPHDGPHLTLAEVFARSFTAPDPVFLARALQVPAHRKLHALARRVLA